MQLLLYSQRRREEGRDFFCICALDKLLFDAQAPEIFCYGIQPCVQDFYTTMNTSVSTSPSPFPLFHSCKIMKTFTVFALHFPSNKTLICGSCRTQNAINNMWSKSPVETDFLLQLRDGSGIDFVHQRRIQTNILFVMVKTGRLHSFRLWGGGCCEREETH